MDGENEHKIDARECSMTFDGSGNAQMRRFRIDSLPSVSD